ncbi:MAG: hypothetical protein DHS20C08_10450 [Rhodomicrobium sp.]|nr:MAG: hypothetical protein DHS20C08_10450 [Rhodomicrobium sp.]
MAQAGRQGNPVYTVSNFQVWAEAKDAVSAKKAALEDGRLIALRVLMKRLTLYTSHKSLPKLEPSEIGKLITSLSVQDERNSSTEYLATMDFQFSETGVKALLRKNQISSYDRQGPEVILVPVVDKSLLGAGDEQKPIISQRDWATSFKTLDLAHGLVPLRVEERLGAIDESVMVALIRGEAQAMRGLYQAYKKPNVVVALLSSSQTEGKLRLSLSGRDGIGDILYKRDFIVSEGNVLQSADLAAEVVQGMFDQRLKILNIKPAPQVAAVKKPVEVLPWQTDLIEAPPVTGWQGEVGGARIMMHVQFTGLRHWQQLRRKLADVPGLEDLNIEKLSARGADVTCQFPGGGEALRAQLAAVGLRLDPVAGNWVLSDVN